MTATPGIAIHAAGCWPRERVRSRLVPTTFAPPPAVIDLVAATWAEAAARPGVHLFDGSALRLESWSADDREFHLAGAATSYRWFLGTNGRNAARVAPYGATAMANAIGTSAVLVTADGWLVFGRRSAHVALYPGWAHPFGGMVEAHEHGDQGAAMARELAEEVGCQADEITELALLGLGQEANLGQPEMFWLARTSLPREQLAGRLAKDEHGALWCVAETAIDDVLARPGDTVGITAITRIALLLYGRHAFGPAWFAAWHPPGIVPGFGGAYAMTP